VHQVAASSVTFAVVKSPGQGPGWGSPHPHPHPHPHAALALVRAWPSVPAARTTVQIVGEV